MSQNPAGRRPGHESDTVITHRFTFRESDGRVAASARVVECADPDAPKYQLHVFQQLPNNDWTICQFWTAKELVAALVGLISAHTKDGCSVEGGMVLAKEPRLIGLARYADDGVTIIVEKRSSLRK